MAGRASHLEQREGGHVVQISLLNLARTVITRLECLRTDLPPDDDAILTSLAQFDFLSNVAAIAGARSAESRVFYSNFARFRQVRIQSIAERLLTDTAMRQILFPLADDDLALALNTIGQRARSEGWSYAGFDRWEGTPVVSFVAEHLPPESSE
jgi:hypothetical protein